MQIFPMWAGYCSYATEAARVATMHGNEIKHSAPRFWSGHTYPTRASLIPVKMGDSAKPIVVINRRHLPIYLGENEIQVGMERGWQKY